MKTGELCKLLRVSSTTLYSWVTQFENHFSDTARGIGVKQRTFNESDVIAAATIAQLSLGGLGLEEIGKHLAQGERVEVPGIAALDLEIMPASAVHQMIDASAIRTELQIVKAERDRLVGMLEGQQNKIEELQERINELIERAAVRIDAEEAVRLRDEIADLREKLARAETRLEEREKRRGWFG